MDATVEELLAAAPGVPLWIKPNAGIPRVVGDEVVYEAGPEELARHLAAYAERGVRVVGGCCGSTPAHVAAIAAALGRRSAS
jgi:5-methyltetrahydrofolate--homocysteine methyltransferase